MFLLRAKILVWTRNFLFGRRPISLVLIQSFNRHEIRANVNKPSDMHVSYSLMHESQKRQIPKSSRANCVTIQLTERAWLHAPGWLALPRWLLSQYYMNQASPKSPWKLCAWAVRYPPSCFSLGSFSGLPGKRDYLENSQPGSRHHKTGIPPNRAGSFVM